MAHSSESHPTAATVQKELRRMRLVFGASLIAMALMLMLILPSVIKNSLFRADADPTSIGTFTRIVHLIQGKEVPAAPEPAPETP